MNIIKKPFFALSLLVFLFSASTAECEIPEPFTLVGTVTVDGSPLTIGSDAGYTFVVTKQDGNDYIPEASDTDGLSGPDLFNIDIPIYEVDEQPGGANPGDTAVIHVYRNGEELIVTSPDNGFITVGASEGFLFLSLSVVSSYTPPPPQPPIADAGPDQDVYEDAIVTLSGLNSTDPDGTIVSFFWEQTSGEPVDLSDPWAPEVSFTSPDVGMDGESLSFRLTVIDNDDSESWDECIVNVVWVNEPPIADAGPDQSVFSGDEVILDASMSSDVDDGIATYLWEWIDGPSVSLLGADSVQATFLAPDVGDAGEALTFSLTVMDNGNLIAVDTCVVNVESWVNSPPLADAGPDQEVYEHDMVTLDGSGSMDWDDSIHSYLWTQKAGTPIVLSDTLVVDPTFYAPEVEIDGEVLTFELTVTDQGGLKSTANCDVYVINNPSEPPLVDFWVGSLTGSLKRNGFYYKAKMRMKVVDENFNPVKRATVTVTWTFNGKNHYTTSSVTNKYGVAKFYSKPKWARSGDEFAVEVTEIDKEGYAYDPSNNSATKRSFIVPKRKNYRQWSHWFKSTFNKKKSKGSI